jgi:hypothetical protein
MRTIRPMAIPASTLQGLMGPERPATTKTSSDGSTHAVRFCLRVRPALRGGSNANLVIHGWTRAGIG